jgi:hypothetical protein
LRDFARDCQFLRRARSREPERHRNATASRRARD